MSLLFDGVVARVGCGQDIGDVFEGNTFSSLVWFKPGDVMGDLDGVISKDQSAPFAFSLRKQSNKLQFIMDADGLVSTLNPSIDVWYYVALTFDSAVGRKFYINSDLDVSDGYTTPATVNDDVFIIGLDYQFGNGREFTGDIAEVSVWNRVLSQDEIQAYMYHPLTGGEQGLVGYWPINDAGIGTSVPIKDITGGGNNGVMSGFSGNPWKEGSPIILGRAA